MAKKIQRKNNKKKKKKNSSSSALTSSSNLSHSISRDDTSNHSSDTSNSDNDVMLSTVNSNSNTNNSNNNNNNSNNSNTIHTTNDMSWTDPSLLRFRVGTKVECNTSKGWLLGEIIKVNYKEDDWDYYVPYQIELQNVDTTTNTNNNNNSNTRHRNNHRRRGINSNNNKNNHRYGHDDHRRIYAPEDCDYVIRESLLLPDWQRRRKRPCQQQIFTSKNDSNNNNNSNSNSHSTTPYTNSSRVRPVN